MQPVKNPASSIALRVATAMHQMGIDGLPRNYELVYEAYAGSNPELVRDFIALGKVKTQEALDALGRKYLPHHHEDGLLARQNGQVRAEMSNFINLLNEEKVSLSDYGRLIGDASKVIQTVGEVDHAELGQSIKALKVATEKRAHQNSNVVRAVVDKTVALADMQREAEDAEAAKFVDPLTGLSSRRAFNKAVAKVYANPEMPVLCGIAIGEIDDFARLSEQMGPAVADRFLKQVAKVMKAVAGDGDLACRFDAGRFGMLLYTSDQEEVSRIVDLVRSKLKATAVVNSGNGRALGQVLMSFGICLSAQAPNAFDFTSFAEKALASSRAAGGNTVTIYGSSDYVPKDWLIYKKAPVGGF
ncbi:GGDEF domain-containing protein [Rhizobium cremeum]|uniref:GGDEF domain-containing protein n=1 Tax=Rhizobium cremeum TaxID=2813827 RepID=UPI000DD977BD|nr:GGDEF domain-containing protein [Rhizobium cremeum]MCJ7996222.1 GGDEF domain-containing protein [Rhizobium cremeum]MCJ8001481.1 GGDEF domain-containing protein [Rhizobium cremeum]